MLNLSTLHPQLVNLVAATDAHIAAALVWCIGNPDALTGWSLMALSIYTLAVIAYSPLMSITGREA